MQQVCYISKREWKSHIQHHRKLDDLRTGFEVAERYRIGHVTEVNFHDAVGQGGLFWQNLEKWCPGAQPYFSKISFYYRRLADIKNMEVVQKAVQKSNFVPTTNQALPVLELHADLLWKQDNNLMCQAFDLSALLAAHFWFLERLNHPTRQCPVHQ